jgi:protein-tyrosine phosphatase
VIDLHCHLLPAIDDGAADLAVAVAMAKASADDGIVVAACTPHIMPGLYHNTGADIRVAVQRLQQELDASGIALQLVPGAENHIVPDFIAGLKSGHLLTLGDTRYVLVELPEHTAPPRLEEFFFSLRANGYAPILAHPERLAWLEQHYAAICRIARAGTWMQVTSGSLSGDFGRKAQYWAERMLDEGYVHLLASDAHDLDKRAPELGEGRDLAAARVGFEEAENLVVTRPRGVLENVSPTSLPAPAAVASNSKPADEAADRLAARFGGGGMYAASRHHDGHGLRGLTRGLRRIFE